MACKAVRGANKGFTLIELLIVVLIIGLLAAVALPQYQFAVHKMRLASWVKIMRALSVSQEAYYLEHGKYAVDLRELDLAITHVCPRTYGYNMLFGCKYLYINNAYWDNVVHFAHLTYCPTMGEIDSGNYDKCLQNAVVNLYVYYKNNAEGANQPNIKCSGNGSLGTRICNSLF